MTDVQATPLIRALFTEKVEANTAGNFFPIRREHSVDSVDTFDSTVAVKLWLKAGAQMIAIIVRDSDNFDDKPFVASLSYARDDATAAIQSPAVGISLYIASPIIKNSNNIQIAIVLSTKERILIARDRNSIRFNQLTDTVSFDVQRLKLNFEPYTYTKNGKQLIDFLSGAWQLFLANTKDKYTLINNSVKKPKYSIVTVFYRNVSLVDMYPMLTKTFDLGTDFELIFCFQESALFKGQIEWLRFIAKERNINLKMVLIEENIGFSAANNIGVEVSAGDTVMILNPDIICSDSTIYEKIMKAAISKRALIGATLLGSAGDIMHNGIDFEYELNFDGKAPINIARTYHIGRHQGTRSLKKNTLKPAKATTGALIAVTKNLWNELGGLSEKYVLAHFEDMDFCHKAALKKIPTLIYQTDALTHVESYSSGESGMSHLIKLVNSNLYNTFSETNT